jgi:hypothetical protein
MELKKQLATTKSWTNTWIYTTKQKKIENTISTNNNQRCKTKKNKINELILSATKTMEQQQERGWREEVLQDRVEVKC